MTRELLACPAVHLNGTSKDELLRQLCRASQVLTAAVEALREASPNQRDYYTQPPEEWRRAQAQHRGWITSVEFVKGEIDDVAFAVSQQGE